MLPLTSALVPWLAFLAATVVADAFVDRTSLSLTGLVLSSPFYLAFVALPSLAPIAIAQQPPTRVGAVVVMTGAAAVAGTLVVTTDDAQAGLAVLLVPVIAVPLALFIGIAQAVTDRRS